MWTDKCKKNSGTCRSLDEDDTSKDVNEEMKKILKLLQTTPAEAQTTKKKTSASDKAEDTTDEKYVTENTPTRNKSFLLQHASRNLLCFENRFNVFSFSKCVAFRPG